MSRNRDLELGFVGYDNERPGTESQRFIPGNDGVQQVVKHRRRHRDAFGRDLSSNTEDSSYLKRLVQNATIPEAYIDPSDGRLRLLEVQCHQPVKHSDRNWLVSVVGSASRPVLLALVDFLYANSSVAPFLYLPVALAMGIFLLFLAKLEPDQERQNNYDPVLYRNWKFPVMANATIADGVCSTSGAGIQSTDPDYYLERNLLQRRPMPRYLCFVRGIDIDAFEPGHPVASHVPSDFFDDYIFISYTRVQFKTEHSNPLVAHEYRKKLLEIGMRAVKDAKDSNVKAFCLDCFPPGDTNEGNEDVYRFCDFVRAAHSVVIAIDSSNFADGITGALQEWGKRLWTLPEPILSKSHRNITVYDSKNGISLSHHKRNLGFLAWDSDWQIASQLIDHYEATVHLTQIELIDIANRCMRRRTTTKYMDGDYAYALMGLLRRRPQVVKTDSDFAAFARLSLSNTSDSIIERLLCMQPPSRDTPWHTMVDAYEAQLKDIELSCQIADVDTDSQSETVVLDGVFGASICWSKLESVNFDHRKESHQDPVAEGAIHLGRCVLWGRDICRPA
ncbi:hypothetical protein M409DRAFT_18436 [Zasmidium cellare ATCC 36951]|uniref:Uncharacterized protein n=1 Tax=Zasmidium cellare ATCC 36951 TaxID=1080233 RepID=A0A6A6CZK9_ZASCE|nr:uncharacterized protein M409DRAFT_18436 [Zasmidium cellare ATCC 36951]KAF2171322.1 hypothetical protein M409DRAFT_18436 [Zasmidium cellare ATCC 36951]